MSVHGRLGSTAAAWTQHAHPAHLVDDNCFHGNILLFQRGCEPAALAHCHDGGNGHDDEFSRLLKRVRCWLGRKVLAVGFTFFLVQEHRMAAAGRNIAEVHGGARQARRR
eukprot:116235-Chlamydomonas_euryale.AAC.1